MGKKKKTSIVLLVLLAALGAVYFVFSYYYGASNFMPDFMVKQITLEEGVLSQGYETETELENVEIPEVTDEMTEDTYNLLLIGIDTNEDDWYGNSDSMILVTVNHSVKKIFLTSFMRDLYAEIPDVGVRKLNMAHALGGGPLLVETIEENYGVKIDNYAKVDLKSMAKVINALGGLDLELTEEEAKYINEKLYKKSEGEDEKFLKGSGMMHLNGKQAVWFARIRRIGNADYERTSRQRRVLTEMFTKFKSLKISEMNKVVNEVLPLITHNISERTMLGLLPQVPEMLSYELVSQRIPYDGMYYSSNEILVPDMEETVAKLQEIIYEKNRKNN